MEEDVSSVKLVGITQPQGMTIDIDKPMSQAARNWTAEDLIAYCARVSNPSNQENTNTASKLLRYCIRKQHWSIFEMVHVVMELNCSRTIGRQILRHRSFSFQEFSQRYAKPTEMEFLTSEARLQDPKNRQNSLETMDKDLQRMWHGYQLQTLDKAEEAYLWAIDNGIAKEVARDVLPEGLTPTRMYMAGSLRSWLTYIGLREKEGTQKEHRDIAKMCKHIICEQFPAITEALGGLDNEWEI